MKRGPMLSGADVIGGRIYGRAYPRFDGFARGLHRGKRLGQIEPYSKTRIMLSIEQSHSMEGPRRLFYRGRSIKVAL